MALRLENVTLGYDRHPAVHHLSGVFASGSLTAVVGPNGAGKSTLLKGLAGALPLLSGQISKEGEASAPGTLRAGQRLAWLPQQAELDAGFPLSVLDVVLMGHWRRVGLFSAISRPQRRQAAEALEAVGLGGFGPRPVSALSVGQRQRVLFARVMLEDSPVILLDEPFAAIDARTTADLLELVHRWHREQRTVIAVLHDFGQVRQHFPQTLLLARKPVAWGPTAEVLTASNLLAARAMSEAWDENARPCRQQAG